MLRKLRLHLSYANVAATLALVFAMGGSAVAATHYLITSSKQISPKVLKELKKTGPAGTNGTEGKPGTPGSEGKQGPEGKEGPQGPRGVEGKQGSEGRPGAQGEKGNASLAAVTWNKTIKTAGESAAKPNTVVLAEVGPFTITGHCYVATTTTVAQTYIESSEEGSVFAETGGVEEEIEKKVPIEVGGGAAGSLTVTHEHSFSGPSEGPFSAQSKSGAIALTGSPSDGVFLGDKAETACYFSGTVVEEK